MPNLLAFFCRYGRGFQATFLAVVLQVPVLLLELLIPVPADDLDQPDKPRKSSKFGDKDNAFSFPGGADGMLRDSEVQMQENYANQQRSVPPIQNFGHVRMMLLLGPC